eukprot:1218_1
MCIQQVGDNYDYAPRSISHQNKQPLNHPHNHLTNLKHQQFDLTPIFSYQQSEQMEPYFFDDIYDNYYNTPKLPPPSNDKKQKRPKLIKYPIKFKISQQVVLPRNYETKSELSYQHTEFKHHVTDKAFYDNLS